MRHSLLATAVIATAVFSATAASQAAEQNAPEPQAMEQAAPPPVNPDLGPDGGRDQRSPHMRRMPGPDILELAARLSAAEIYLGVTPEQLGPWRAYTTALIDLVSPGPERNPLPPKAADAATAPASPAGNAALPEPRLAGETLAGIIAQKAEKAKALQDAVATLKQKLSPQQVSKLAELERALIPPPPPGPRHGPEDGRFVRPHGDMPLPLPGMDRG